MPHSFNKIWVHAIWATKERMPLIHQNIEQKVYQYISEQLREQGCPVRIINGMPDHVHCLFLLNPQKSIAEVIKQMKGSSSHFINQNNFIAEKFAWQTGYAAFSVSESIVEKVFEYIKNQNGCWLKNLSSFQFREHQNCIVFVSRKPLPQGRLAKMEPKEIKGGQQCSPFVFWSINNSIATEKNATPAPIALGWLLAQKPFIVPIPGTTKLHRLQENIGAANIILTTDELSKINAALATIKIIGERYPAQIQEATGRK